MKKTLVVIFILILIGAAIYTGKEIFSPRGSSPSTAITNNTSSRTLSSVTILSTPSEALVSIDGKNIGTTPLTLGNLKNTPTRLTLEKKGYETISVLLPSNEVTPPIQFILQPTSSSPQASLSITVGDTESDFQTDIDTAIFNDPNIPESLAGLIVVPEGFRFPDNANPEQIIPLDIIPPTLNKDPSTGRMFALERSNLLTRLSTQYVYDPANQDIVAETLSRQISLINFGSFEPNTLSLPNSKEITWYNHNTAPCLLRTDPKSPELINQKIDIQKTLTLSLTKPGIYVFFCQGKPGPTQTITVL